RVVRIEPAGREGEGAVAADGVLDDADGSLPLRVREGADGLEAPLDGEAGDTGRGRSRHRRGRGGSRGCRRIRLNGAGNGIESPTGRNGLAQVVRTRPERDQSRTVAVDGPTGRPVLRRLAGSQIEGERSRVIRLGVDLGDGQEAVARRDRAIESDGVRAARVVAADVPELDAEAGRDDEIGEADGK